MKKLIPIFMLALVLGAMNSCQPFWEKDISKKIIYLNAPQEGDTLTGQVNFWWNEIESAAGYRLQVAAPNFSSPSLLVLDTFVHGYSFLYQLPPGTYQWRIRAENANSETSYSTRTLFIFASQDLSTQTVIQKSPVNAAAFKDSLISFSWFPISTATSYTLQIADSAGVLQYQETLTSDSISIVFPSEGYYSWKVKAQNATTETVYTSRNFYFDKTSPNQPALTAPIFGDTITAGSVLLQWSRGIEYGSPVTDSIFIYTDSLNTLSGIYYSNLPSYQLNTAPGIFFWRIRSVDKAGNASPYSSTFKFKSE